MFLDLLGMKCQRWKKFSFPLFLLVLLALLTLLQVAMSQEMGDHMPRRRQRRHGRKRMVAVNMGDGGTGIGSGAESSTVTSSSTSPGVDSVATSSGSTMATVMSSVNECDIKFVKYQSSPYETKWTNEILTRELNPCLYIVLSAVDGLIY